MGGLIIITGLDVADWLGGEIVSTDEYGMSIDRINNGFVVWLLYPT